VTHKSLERVLANWLSEAIGSEDRLPPETTPAAWVARRAATWLSEEAGGPLAEAEGATARLRVALEQAGGWGNPQLADAMDELTHVSEAIGDLRQALGSAGVADA
jgi:hypothetical protein